MRGPEGETHQDMVESKAESGGLSPSLRTPRLRGETFKVGEVLGILEADK